jgi:hypothetical protein
MKSFLPFTVALPSRVTHLCSPCYQRNCPPLAPSETGSKTSSWHSRMLKSIRQFGPQAMSTHVLAHRRRDSRKSACPEADRKHRPLSRDPLPNLFCQQSPPILIINMSPEKSCCLSPLFDHAQLSRETGPKSCYTCRRWDCLWSPVDWLRSCDAHQSPC